MRLHAWARLRAIQLNLHISNSRVYWIIVYIEELWHPSQIPFKDITLYYVHITFQFTTKFNIHIERCTMLRPCKCALLLMKLGSLLVLPEIFMLTKQHCFARCYQGIEYEWQYVSWIENERSACLEVQKAHVDRVLFELHNAGFALVSFTALQPALPHYSCVVWWSILIERTNRRVV